MLTQYVLEVAQTQRRYVGQATAVLQDVCVLKVERAGVHSVLQDHRCTAVLLPTATVLVAHIVITAEQSVTTLVVFGLPVPMVATLIDVADSHVQHF